MEFSKEVYVHHLRSTEKGFLIIWGWDDSHGDDDHEPLDNSDGEVDCSIGSDNEHDENDERDEDTVALNGSGVTQDTLYQTILKEVKERIKSGEKVPVKIKPI